MAGLIKRSDIDEVRSRTNIGEIVGEYVTLKRAGVGSLSGLCPFHDERSPSFHVRPQVGFYHCFGCGEGGDVFTFLQKMDHVTFSEAVERLAQRLNFTLSYEDGGPAREEQGNRRRILAANEAAEAFFREQLVTAAAEPARRFLGERGFDPASADRFSIGFAPQSFDALRTHLTGRGFSTEELLAAGLLSQGDRSAYDRFRGRLLWPIKDVTGQTLGFGARRLLDDDKGPKYLNTPETPVYHKAQVLYGLDLAKRDIARAKQVVVVEGYTDVMACHLAGVTTAVATCGTSFGVDHIKVIRRVMGDTANADTTQLGEVVFTFDPDDAGQKAASRAFAEESRFAAQTFVAVAPDGLDPCDLRLARGDDAVRMLVSGRKPMYEFMIRRQLEQFDLETVEGRVGALRAAAPVVAGIRDRSMQSGYGRTLAGWIGLDPQEVARAVQSARTAAAAKPADAPRGRADAPRASGQGQDARSAGSPTPPAPEAAPSMSIDQLPTDPVTRLERELLMAVLQHPGEVDREVAARALATTFTQPALATVRDALVAAFEHYGTQQWVARSADEAPGVFAALVTQLAIAPLPIRDDQVREYCRGLTTSLIGRDLLRRKTELLGALQRTSAAEDPDRYRALQRQLVDTEAERRRVLGD
ncbi:DNA primase [Microcella daejeonensis]|uniref:DNA primase n=1 Tax=Microcella daejeonensis TaxID=2994971 RepID=A0A9E8MK98_9MICO|nr:DNA primase [Microcella daejeonensis]WAB81087.1 DNA primase [Microcella daejeonensis]